eukprot:TRINITY_DN2406_c0_g1_i1.p2 TRINITY_DN2406_c0_g1~~TRINITY_DN2406_c0_g1_i1.p2  ORF type:complete len:138 (-),score=32.21 TRINITY_DN2406_c0_g1_i1:13-426(-)
MSFRIETTTLPTLKTEFHAQIGIGAEPPTFITYATMQCPQTTCDSALSCVSCVNKECSWCLTKNLCTADSCQADTPINALAKCPADATAAPQITSNVNGATTTTTTTRAQSETSLATTATLSIFAAALAAVATLRSQ